MYENYTWHIKKYITWIVCRVNIYPPVPVSNKCREDELEMYADDTTLTCFGETVDQVVLKLNKTLSQVNTWCQRNGMTIHPTKTEAMLVKRGTFVGPLPPVRPNDIIVFFIII